MLIKEPSTSRGLAAILPRRHGPLYKIIFFLLALLFAGLIAAGLMLTGAQIQKTGFMGHTLKPLLQQNVRFIPKYLKGLAAQPERIIIDIKHTDFQQLAFKREQALETGILITSAEDFVPAQIRYGEKTVRAKVRLKGDWTDGLLDQRWPLRVRIRGNETLFGMKQFSLHHPRVRNYIHEWIYHQALKREGVLSLRYDFVDVTINGEHLGIYALEEHFYKHLIEHNGQREGPILKLDESVLWSDRLQAAEKTGWQSWIHNATGLQSDQAANVTAFQEGKIQRTPRLLEQFKAGMSLLETFRRGELPASNVFDVPKMARYLAVSEVMGAMHSAAYWNNWRFYYNPVTSRLEPIGFDANAGQPISGITFSYLARFPNLQLFMKDRALLEAYLQDLREVSEPTYLDALFKEIQPDLDRNLNILYRSHVYDYTPDNYYHNQAVIRRSLEPVQGVRAYFNSARDGLLTFEVGNIQTLPLDLVGLSHSNGWAATLAEPTTLSPANPYRPTAFQEVAVPLPEKPAWSDDMSSGLQAVWRIPGLPEPHRDVVYPWPRVDTAFRNADIMRREPNVSQFAFLSVDEISKRVFIEPGTWAADDDIIVPTGYTLVGGPSTTVDLSKGANLVSYSPITLLGEEDAPFVIRSSDGSGQGVVVVKGGQDSTFSHVTFENLGTPKKADWELTGAITFFESPVRFTHCRFLGNRSEDGLNIIRSDFTIDRCLFSDTTSDAFDSDFCSGLIRDSSFVDCGNDCMDFSGSLITIERASIEGSGDKAVSVGEDSQVTATGVHVAHARLGLVSKDLSTLTLTGARITDSQTAFAAYQKKPEFAGATIVASGVETRGVAELYWLEPGSNLTIDGANKTPNREHLAEIIYAPDQP